MLLLRGRAPAIDIVVPYILDGGTGHNFVSNAPVVAAASVTTSPAAGAALLGQFMASSFVSAAEGHGALPVADPSVSQEPQLALPHAA